MTSLTCTNFTLLTTASILLQIAGLWLFVFGFFPIKPALSGVSGPESFRPPSRDSVENQNVTALHPDQLKSLYQELSEIPPSYDRLILMVIDGLPAEFVLGRDGEPPLKTLKDAMPYTQSLLANKMALGFHSKAAPPTVTLPRLKAMTTGSIGGFLDVLFNFNTQALLEDNIVGQLFRIGWKMVMFGDETWLKLFPGLFTQHDGVSSFFVKDTVQVDHNVSRHLNHELFKSDWNLLILHYLGLDHVGHLGGRTSSLMGPKLKEMDDVIKLIHSNIIKIQESDHRRTLVVVVSDHGMQENGNHGGSSYEETDSLALFIGPKTIHISATDHVTVNQVDITPTLALLFGVPIPKNNAGYLIADLFHQLQDEQILRAMELNSLQLLRLLEAQATHSTCETSLEDTPSCLFLEAVSLHKSWKSKNLLRSATNDDFKNTLLAYKKFLKKSSQQLSHTATDKPIGILFTGIMAMTLSCIIFLFLIFKLNQEIYHLSSQNPQLSDTFVTAVIVIIVLSMGSSSLIEEEQYLWHFMTSTLFLILFRKSLLLQSPNKKLLLISTILISGRVLRGWHQGGVNWTYLPDISKSLEASGSFYIRIIQILSLLVIIALYFYSLSFLKKNVVVLIGAGGAYFCAGLMVLNYVVKYQGDGVEGFNNDGILAVRMIYGIIVGLISVTVIGSPWLFMCSGLQDSVLKIKDSLYLCGTVYVFGWCLLQLLLQKPVNCMPISLLLVQILAMICYASYGGDLDVKQWVEIGAIYYLGMAGHFSLGNTNTLATIDVAGAFIGISSHSTVLSGLIMFVITYASPMLAFISMVMSISMKDMNPNLNMGQLLKRILGFPCLVPLGLNSVLLVAYTIILLLMRNHLFIWTVFSPKYIYMVVTTACVLVGVLIVASTVTYVVSVIFIGRRLYKYSAS
ncbi:hypothetical protein LXL04_024915 [Taraxacum kok-saghyz]